MLPRSRRGLLLLALAVPSTALALDPSRPLARYQRERWGGEEGFPGGGVHAIAQDADGYLWLGTEKGLVRFDGREFNVVPGRESVSAGSPEILRSSPTGWAVSG
jgi:ligand-binding sensor domain-containing protein